MTIRSLNLNLTEFSRATGLYFFGVALYSAIALAVIFSFADIADIARAGNQFVIDGKVKLYWGMIFGPVFLALTLPSAFRAVSGLRRMNRLEAALALWCAGDLAALAVGLVRQNQLRYLAGDTFILSIIPLSYFFILNNVRSAAEAKRLFYLMLAVQFIFLTIPVTWGTPPQREGYTVLGLYTFSGSEALVTISLMAIGTFSKRKWPCIILIIAAVSISLLRTRMSYILQVASAVPVLLAVHFTEKGFLRSFGIILSATLAALLFMTWSGVMPFPPSYQRTGYFLRSGWNNAHIKMDEYSIRLKALLNEKSGTGKKADQGEGPLDGREARHEPERMPAPREEMPEIPMSQRLYETRVVVDSFRKNPAALVFGFGNGSTLELKDTPDITMRMVYGENIARVHSIHFLPFAIIYRQGVAGVILFLVLVHAAASLFMKAKPAFSTLKSEAIITEILFLNVLAMLIGSLTAAPHLFINLTVGFSLGLIGVMTRQRGESDERRSEADA